MRRRMFFPVLGAAAGLAATLFSREERSDNLKKSIQTDKAPKAIGPYSQAIVANGLVFCSGQIPLDPASGEIVPGTIEDQARRVLQNLGAVLEAAGCSFDHVVKTTVFLQDMNDFAKMNGIYGEFFKPPYPARAAVQAARLPKDVKIEIEAVAVLK